ncbi:type VII secretion integral membrane protein EccD [Streptomyces sp. NPDC001985]|uniref:type VII secretion integral membrane protein EccD n=1 Tax=Streptomyces sp. NPDC001985 TaxID=3154406 RepID=UPI0033317821
MVLNPSRGPAVHSGVTSHAAGDLCRMMLVTPASSLEVAVPSDVPLHDLMPALLGCAGPGLADSGLDHDGWVIQRLGEPALDEERTLTALAVRDGETLHLRPRRSELPVIDYDDLITGVAEGVRGRPDRWSDRMTRVMFLALMSLALVVAWAVLLLDGPEVPRAAAAAGAALLALVTGAVVARVLDDTALGGLLGLASVLFAAQAGYLAAAVPGTDSGPARTLAAGAAALTVTVLAMGAVARWLPGFAAALTAAAALAIGGLLSLTAGLERGQSAAVVLVVALVFNATVPMTAFRLADLRLPLLPTTADELQDQIEPVGAGRVLERAVVADQYMTALFAAVGLVCGAALFALDPADGWAPATLYGASCAALLLRARVLTGAGQRIALLVPAVLGCAAGVVGAAGELTPVLRPVGPVPLLVVVAGLLLAAARVLPGRRLVPYWGRAAEIGELLIGVSMLPVLLAVLGTYGWALALFG